MPRLSKPLEKLENTVEARWGVWFQRHKKKLPLYIPVGLVCWYFYGMLLNSMRLGIDAVFHNTGQDVTAIWIFNPIRNWLAIFSGFGLKATAFFVLMFCLVTKRGYLWFSGYKYTRDPRGFDILPDGTHGSSGFLTKWEMESFLEIGPIRSVSGMLLGKIKERPEDPDKYAAYVAHRMVPGENNNLLCIGAPGSWKTRGLILPFLMGCAQRKESVFCVDPKGELFEQLSPYFRENGHYVKAVNFLDMAHSDGWNCLYGLDTETDLVQTVANTIIQNTSSPKEADDFWSRAELNLLMALIHYVCNLRDEKGDLLPIEQRGLGDVYQILATMSVNELNRTLASLPPDHPAKGHHGLFLKARENLWGNIITGLGNRLAIFQNKLVDTITRNHDVDLVLPGQRPCAYFIIISAQDSAYRFLSSLFFSLAMPQLSNYARLHCKGGRLPVLVNFCLDEYCNIGYMEGIADALNSVRGFNIACQVVVQSLSQWQQRYPGKEWENQLNTFNQTIYMDCNDLTSAKYISEKCGKVTIAVTNNQMPMQPLFSPIYSYQEISAPSGYVVDNTKYQITITATALNITQKRTNTPAKAGIEIVKVDADHKTPLQGVGFRLYDASGKQVTEGYTDANGKLTFSNLRLGSYTYKEFKAPDGYVLDTAAYSAVLNQNGQVLKVTRENIPVKGSIEVLKVDAETKQPLAGVVYRLFDADGNKVADGMTDATGKVTFSGLRLGKHAYQEINTVDGYVLDETKYDFSLTTANLNIKVTRENAPAKGSITVRKVDVTGSPLAGAELRLETSADGKTWTEVGKITTDSTGVAKWENLKIGAQYRVTETKAPAGYTLLTEPLVAGVLDSSNRDVTITACNNAGFALPFTGGTGFTTYILFAALALMVGVCFCKKIEMKENTK